MNAIQITGVVLLSGFASLDRLAGLNIMLSRPFVIAGIIGFISNNVVLCLFIGILFEFIGMLEVPIGTTIVNDDTFGGYAASLSAALGFVSHNALSLLFCICITIIIMYPVTLSDILCRNFNRRLIEHSINSNKPNIESRLISYGLIVSFFRGIFVYNIAAIIILFILYLIDKIHNTSYEPYMYLVLLAVFLGGYLVRFFAVNILLKAALLIIGIICGWFFI